jgi:hypothetical protein
MQLSSLNRQLLFLLGCIPVRLLLVACAIYLSSNPIQLVNHSRLNYMHKLNLKNIFSVICVLIGIGFIISFINGKTTGFFGGRVWWNYLRLIHAINFISYGIYSLQGYKWALFILLLDIIIGMLGFGLNYLV